LVREHHNDYDSEWAAMKAVSGRHERGICVVDGVRDVGAGDAVTSA
jgi:hypothetical protein